MHKDPDGFLYLTYRGEDVFGGNACVAGGVADGTERCHRRPLEGLP